MERRKRAVIIRGNIHTHTRVRGKVVPTGETICAHTSLPLPRGSLCNETKMEYVQILLHCRGLNERQLYICVCVRSWRSWRLYIL